MSTTVAPSPNPKASLHLPLWSVIAAVASLAFIVYWTIHDPAGSTLPLVAFMLTSSVSASAGMVAVMSLPENSSPMLRSSTVTGWLVCLLAALGATLLATPQIELRAARLNIDGATPTVALQASEVLRENPLNIRGATSLLTPVLQSSVKPEDMALFHQAQEAGVQGEVIDRVLTNGFVHPDDKHALVQELLAHAQDGGSEAVELLALMANSR